MKAGWGRPFEDPIELDECELVTLLDAVVSQLMV